MNTKTKIVEQLPEQLEAKTRYVIQEGRGITEYITDDNSKALKMNTLTDDLLAKINKISVLENRADKYVTGVQASRQDNRVTLTYTFSDRTNTAVSFDDKDTIAVAYNDEPLLNRISDIEKKLNQSVGVYSLLAE